MPDNPHCKTLCLCKSSNSIMIGKMELFLELILERRSTEKFLTVAIPVM